MSQSSRIAHLVSIGMTRPHGTRTRYNSGCRCDDCRESNRAYEARRIRKHIFHGPAYVDAVPVCQHIQALQTAGVGCHTISRVAGVRYQRVRELLAGRRRHCKAETARRILEVTEADRADGALVPAGPTLHLIDDLVQDGYTKRQIAAWLGSGNKIQFRRTGITQRSADRVLALYHKIRDGFIERKQ